MIWRKPTRADDEDIPLLTEVVGIADDPAQQLHQDRVEQEFQRLTQALTEQTLQRVAPLLEDALTDPLRLSIEERLQAMLPGLVDALRASIRADLQGLVQEAVTQGLREAQQQLETNAQEIPAGAGDTPHRL
jgi:uncharacterized membrane protein YheB (UPF0754 family)